MRQKTNPINYYDFTTTTLETTMLTTNNDYNDKQDNDNDGKDKKNVDIDDNNVSHYYANPTTSTIFALQTKTTKTPMMTTITKKSNHSD